MQKLEKSSAGSLAASQLGADINKRAAWARVLTKLGGLKSFCLDRADKIKWISEGSGRVELVNIGSVPVDAMLDSSSSLVLCVTM